MSFILSPHGEGYCKVCRFIVGLGPDGLMDMHYRGRHSRERYGDELEPCKGSGRRPAPPARVPYSSRRSRFRYEPPMARCPQCGQTVRVTTFNGSDTHYFLRHQGRPGRVGSCLMTGDRVPDRVEVK